jgi:two-component system response regulator MprA
MARASNSPGRIVFVVDDDASLVESITDVLTDEGYRVEGFTDPEEALARLRAGGRPAALMLDLLMPGMSGDEFLAALAADGVDVPVLLLSGLTEPGAAAGAVAAVLPKPFDLDRLLAELARVIAA